ncbi:DUF3300 domain-containing protein [Dyella psychrodurans]|uniref:DUF3300 domain-containing protein n=1 Tax=Dyella psychrodurans TaxID=1927960 RepID=UPI001314D604|nr:DUF3300 domain-containing protein [Dyella psychrodurans]
MTKHYSTGPAIAAGLCATMLVLAACSQQASNSANAPASSATAPAASATGQQAYTPPTADQLYQLVAPIALFPDKLVAQVLAGATYPDQITAAENLVTQNPNLKGDLLQAAVQPQNWDPSVKGLTQFPSVLSQMAQNVQWTTALGQAYVNDPTDVLNAIQVMRQRAAAQGNLRSSTQQQVVTQPVQQVAQSEDESGYADNGSEPPVYSGPDVVPPPSQIIQIEPAQSDAVYVPSYDPQTVYGGDVPYYPSYQYEQPTYTTGEVVAVGAVAFGAAIIIGSMLDNRHEGGWHSWGMNWHGGGGGGYNGGGQGGGWHHPAVVYNNQTYVSRSTTVINRYTNITNNRYNTVNNTNYVNNSRTFNNNSTTNNVNNNRNEFNRNAANNVTNNNRPAGQPMSVPNFARAGYPPAAAPRAAAEAARPVQVPHPEYSPRPMEAPRANIAHEQPNVPAPTHPAFTPRPQEAVHQPVPQAPQPERVQPAFHPVPAPQPERAQPVFHPAPAPQPQRAQPVFHPASAPQQQAHPQPPQRPAPAVAPAPRFVPPPAQPAPPSRPQPQPQPRPQPQPQPQAHAAPPPPPPQQHQNNNAAHQPPPKKDDKQHN